MASTGVMALDILQVLKTVRYRVTLFLHMLPWTESHGRRSDASVLIVVYVTA